MRRLLQLSWLDLLRPCTRCGEATAARCDGCDAPICGRHAWARLCWRCYVQWRCYCTWD
jgi:hypothetical protein